MVKKFPVNPKHPERNCWGCNIYCSAKSMMCGNGSERTQHPVELFGADWMEWGAEAPATEPPATEPPVEAVASALSHAG